MPKTIDKGCFSSDTNAVRQHYTGLKMTRKIHYYLIPHKSNGYRPHILRPHFLSFYSVLVLFAKVAVTAALFFNYVSPAAFAQITTSRIVVLANEAREQAGLPALASNQLLDKAAYNKAVDMLQNGYFNHENPDGLMPWHFIKESGYLYSYAGENLAMDFTKAEAVQEAWMQSPSHRANILNVNYKDIGIAVVQGNLHGKKTTLLVQFFGTSFTEADSLKANINPPIALERPAYTEYLSDNSNPSYLGENVAVTLKAANKKDFVSMLAYYTQKFYWVVLALLAAALLLNIFVRIKKQHKSVITQTVLVLVLIAFLLTINTHFLENLPISLKII